MNTFSAHSRLLRVQSRLGVAGEWGGRGGREDNGDVVSNCERVAKAWLTNRGRAAMQIRESWLRSVCVGAPKARSERSGSPHLTVWRVVMDGRQHGDHKVTSAQTMVAARTTCATVWWVLKAEMTRAAKNRKMEG